MTLIRKIRKALKAPAGLRRGGARMIDITRCDEVGFDAALDGSQPFGRTRLLDGGGYIHPRRMLWSCEIEGIQRPHLSRAKIPDIDLYFVTDAIVGGHGSHLLKDGKVVFAEGPYPEYVKFWFENGITPQQWAVTAPVEREIDTAFVIAHFNFVWGHWLTEIYPKLFLIKALAKIGVSAPILLPKTAPGYVADIIGQTLPGQEIVFYDPVLESVRVRRALLPHMLNRQYVFHDFLLAGLDGEALAAPRWGEPGKLFVSRRNLKDTGSYRRMLNHDEIEDIAETIGLQPISPEQLSWSDQISAFANASVVVGEFGSGLHNTLFSPAQTKVMGLNWIVDVQSRIANFKQHDIGYLLAPDGVPRTHTLAEGVQDYTIDPEAFRFRVQQVMEAADRPPLRRYEDIPVLRPTARTRAG